MMGRADQSGTRQQALLDPIHLTWTPTGSGKADANLEEGWTLLPGGGVLVIHTDPETNPSHSGDIQPPDGHLGERLVPPWSHSGTLVPAEMGPQVLRADGSVIVFGALTSGVDHTAIYQSASGTLDRRARSADDQRAELYAG